MAAPLHLLTDPYRRDVVAWNRWRVDNALTDVNLSGADLTGAYLFRANLTKANLTGAYLFRANLTKANLTGAYLFRANLTKANLTGANLSWADLRWAVGLRHPDAVAAAPVGSGQLCSALRNADGTTTIWAGCETFSGPTAVEDCRARIASEGGQHEAERNAWLDWVVARLSKQVTP